MNKIFLLLLAFSIYSNALEYDSIHDETYWYFEDDAAAEGWYVGTVRSNIVYGDKLRFAISEETCDQTPAMYFTLSSMLIPEIKKDNPDFNIMSMEGNKIIFNAYLDEYEPLIINATIMIADEVDSVSSMFFIEFDQGMPRNFISSKKHNSEEFIEIMMLEIPENDPNYKYFDITQMKFRMGGLVNVWMHAHQLCLDAGENDE
ncbi:hypothetical protein N8149_00210 [Gammaproteobacteria bacterium]|nr:hypothetical protein [Gammaproteobacteria bacterium]